MISSSSSSSSNSASVGMTERITNSGLGTRMILVVMFIVHIIQLASTASSSAASGPGFYSYFAAISASSVLLHYQVWRLITNAFFHGGWLHLLMNSLSLNSIGGSLERKLGTIRFLLLSLFLCLSCGMIYVLTNAALYGITGNSHFMESSAIGISGVIFAMMVISDNFSGDPINSTRNLFGVISIPTIYYPFICLFALQILIPQVSFIGHLSGILSGLLYCYSSLHRDIIPSSQYVRENIDESRCLSFFRVLPSYVLSPGLDSFQQSSWSRFLSASFLGVNRIVNISFELIHSLHSTIKKNTGYDVLSFTQQPLNNNNTSDMQRRTLPV